MTTAKEKTNHLQFTRKVPRLLKLRKGKKNPFHILPFSSPRMRTFNGEPGEWDVPATGGYFGGYNTGEAMALAYLKCARSHGKPNLHFYLTKIVESFMIRFEQAHGIEGLKACPVSDANDGFPALRGQYVGFFNTLSDWLDRAAASHLGNGLDALEYKGLLRTANAGLQFDNEAFMDSHSDEEKSHD